MNHEAEKALRRKRRQLRSQEFRYPPDEQAEIEEKIEGIDRTLEEAQEGGTYERD